ncbi:MAG: mannose-6-phosphate isomerase, partial [Paludibacteraceae bacterium]|nr:mannose-6-phosphate isomerase [Paludibacteraceae bacterium]
MLYPLLFHPITKPKVWGSETWLLSGYGDDQSVVANGFLKGNSIGEVLEIYMDELVGGKVYDRYGSLFPLLFKIIDANDNLSVQVHPDDEQAAATAHDNDDVRQLGKTEMWVVTKAEQDASIILGFARPTNAEEVQKSLSENTITDLLQVVPVKKDD